MADKYVTIILTHSIQRLVRSNSREAVDKVVLLLLIVVFMNKKSRSSCFFGFNFKKNCVSRKLCCPCYSGIWNMCLQSIFYFKFFVDLLIVQIINLNKTILYSLLPISSFFYSKALQNDKLLKHFFNFYHY